MPQKYTVHVDVGFGFVFDHKPTEAEIDAELLQKLKNAVREVDHNLIRYTIEDPEGNEISLED